MTTEKNMLDALIQHQVYSYRASTKIVNELLGEYTKASNKLAVELKDKLDNLTQAEQSALLSGKYTTDNLKEIKQIFDDWYDVLAVQIPESFAVSATALAVYEAGYMASLYGDSVNAEKIAKPTLNKIKSEPVVSGMRIKDIWSNIAEQTRNQALYAVRDGIQQGVTTKDIVKSIRGERVKRGDSYEYVGGIINAEKRKNEIETNIRTIRSVIANDAYSETFKALGFEYVKDVSVIDGRTSLTCISRDGVVQKADSVTKRPPYHYNCLLGDSHVLTVGNVSGASKRWFDGEIIIIKTSKGRVLRCTPNHPILTSRGWVASGVLDVGGDVVCDLIGDWVATSVSNHENAPPLIEDVVNSIFSSSEVVTMPVPVSAKDFHNDGVGSKVAIVASDSFLSSGNNTSITKHFSESNFIARDPVIGKFLNRFSSFNKFGFRLGSTSSSYVGVFGKIFNFILSVSGHSSNLLFRSVSKVNSINLKDGGSSSNTNTDSVWHTTNTDSRIKASNNILFCFSRLSKLVNNMLLRPISNAIFFNASSDNIVNGVSRNIKADGDVLLRKSINVHCGNGIDDFFVGKSTYDDFKTCIKNNVSNDGLINGVSICDAKDGFTSVIGLDYISSIKRKQFSGHVYNLETDDGYYVANGIITHNCRTVQVGCDKDGNIDGKRPFVADTRSVKNIPKDERSDKIGQVDANTTYSDWFARQPASFQKEVLGKTKYELYKKGGFTFDKFVDPLGKPYSIAELRALDQKTFKELGL